MSVIIDDNAGFCFGVVKAIAAAEEELSHSESLYCLGDIVHNDAEVHRLASKGLRVINNDQFEQLHDTKVLIRAHGEPPATYAKAQRQGIHLVDATCPIVLALQKKVKEGYEEMQRVGGQVVIFGKLGHAEVVGLNGQTHNTAVIVSTPDDLASIDFSMPIRLYSQTTKNNEDYQRLITNIQTHRPADFVAYNTICNRVNNRAKQLEEFAQSVDAVVFVSGPNSSNGHYLYDLCRRVQPNTFFVASPDDEALQQIGNRFVNIGITGATSTPSWLMEQVKLTLELKN